jgi:hypothetical protein
MRTSPWLALLVRLGIALILLCLGIVVWGVAGGFLRLLAAAALVAFAGGLFWFVRGRGIGLAIRTGLVFVAVVIAPLDVSFLNYPGPPGIVPVRPGYAEPVTNPRTWREAVVPSHPTGFEPKWVLVW